MIIIIGNDFQPLSVEKVAKNNNVAGKLNGMKHIFWLALELSLCVINYKLIVKVINYFGKIFPKMIIRVCNKCDTNLVCMESKRKCSVCLPSFFELWLWWDVC